MRGAPAALALLGALAGACTLEDRVARLPCATCGPARGAYCGGSGPPPLTLDGACGGAAAARRFQHALCACEGLGGAQPLRSDSFDSGSGAAGRRGAVATNGKLDSAAAFEVGGELIVAGAEGARTATRLTAAALSCAGPLGGDGAAVEIDGDAAVGGDVRLASLRVAGALTLAPASQLAVSGAQAIGDLRRGAVSVAPPCACAGADLIDVAGLIEAARQAGGNDDAELGLGPDDLADFGPTRTLELACGRYYLRRVQGGALTLRATGRVALYIAEGVTLAGPLRVEVGAGAELDLLVGGALNLAGTLTVDSAGAPSRTRLYAGAAGALAISGGARVEMLLYAPLQDLAVSGAAELSGALLVRRVQHTGPLALRRDEAAARLGDRCR